MARIINSTNDPGQLRPPRKLTDAQKKALNERRGAMEKKKARKLDTRRKVILGGALIARARAGQLDAQSMLQEIYDTLPEREKSAFTDWIGKEC